MDGLSALGDAAARGNEPNISDLNGCVFGASGRMDASYGGANAGYEFSNPEWLGHVIVGTEFQRMHLFVFAIAHREHEHREPRSEQSNAAEGLNATNSGHIEIKQHSVKGLSAKQVQRH